MNFAIDKFDPRRFGLITGSKVSPLVPKRSADVGRASLAKELATEKYFRFYDEVSTWQTEHGDMAEYWAREHYTKHYGELKGPRFICINENEGGTIDDESVDAQGNPYGIDFKSPTSLNNWLSYLFDGISDKEYNQCQHYLHLTGYKYWYICAFLLETKFMEESGLTYPVPTEKRMIRIKVEPSQEWLDKYNDALPFVVSERDRYYELLKKHFQSS